MDFYRINENYNQYLQRYEKEKRGVTKVPNISIWFLYLRNVFSRKTHLLAPQTRCTIIQMDVGTTKSKGMDRNGRDRQKNNKDCQRSKQIYIVDHERRWQRHGGQPAWRARGISIESPTRMMA